MPGGDRRISSMNPRATIPSIELEYLQRSTTPLVNGLPFGRIHLTSPDVLLAGNFP